MICAWKDFLAVLPFWIRESVDRQGKTSLLELRLRINSPPEMVMQKNSVWLNGIVTEEDLLFCFNTACHYSPWAAQTSEKGYVSISGGHRIGICGEAVVKNGKISGFRKIKSLCIRIARDFPEIGLEASEQWQSALIIGPPGWGKTTLLRGIARKLAQEHYVAVADERCEIFPDGYLQGRRMDVLSGGPKAETIEMLLRTMGPEYIAVDEITGADDATALYHATGCGVRLLATAHAANLEDFYSRPVYRPLAQNNIFQTALVMSRDKSFHVEMFRYDT